MITESGPPPLPSEDDTPTQTFGIIRPDDPPPAATSATPAPAPREEHGLTALLERDSDELLPRRTKERRSAKVTAVLGAVVLIVLGVAAYEVVSGVGHGAKTAAASTHPARPSAAAPSTVPAISAPATVRPSAPASSAPAPPPVVVRTLRPVSAIAVGPGGRTGDDPRNAQSVLGSGTRTPWQTDWYDTAEFGGLQTGTGLLLDLGSVRTVDAVTVALGIPGVNLQIRAGQSANPGGLGVVATAAGAHGAVQLRLSRPAHARYLLIWFTRLAPNGRGTYQAEVNGVTVLGS